VPIKLYRCFKSREHADQLLAGRVRFGILEYYKELEEPGRGDPGEGRGVHTEYRQDRMAAVISAGTAREVKSPGPVTVHSECGNPVYIYSLTNPPDAEAWDRAREDFGAIVVEIDDVERLRAEIAAALDPADPWQRKAPVALWPAQYKKGEELSPTVDAELIADPVKRAVTLKPRSYEYQHEHRLALFSYGLWQEDGDPPLFLTVRLSEPLTYARVL
jgi:hypothetical protein